ncbi:MAG: hypothetical protein ACNI27_02880 [Desulfovibrio sp.]
MPTKFIILIAMAVVLFVVCLVFIFTQTNGGKYAKIKVASIVPATPNFGIHYIAGSDKSQRVLSPKDIRAINGTLDKYSKHIANFDLYLNNNISQEKIAQQAKIVSFEGIIETTAGPALAISANRCSQKRIARTVTTKIRDSLQHYYRLRKEPKYQGTISTIYN